MRTIKTSLAGFILFVILVSGLFMTCEIGLGDAVDTQPPTVSITYPPANSVIRDNFILAGTAKDETSLKSVVVTLTNVDTNESAGSWNATINQATNTWTCPIGNAPVVEGEFAPIADGEYRIDIVATDNANRNSGVKVNYFIDNTPPLVAITRPSTNKTMNPEPYGDTIIFKGDLWDYKNCSAIKIDFFDAEGKPIEGGTHIEKNVLSTWEFSILQSVFEILEKGMAIDSGLRSFYYTLTAYDDAFLYQSPETAKPTETLGNATTRVYVGSDLTKNTSTNALTLKQLSSIDSGKEISGLIESSELRKLSMSSSEYQSKNSGSFSIDPLNKNPTVEVSGLTWFPAETFETGESKNQIAGKSIVNITIKQGKSEKFIHTENPPVYVYIRDLTDPTREPLIEEAIPISGISFSDGAIDLNYEIPKTEGSWVLIVQAADDGGYTTTRTDELSEAYEGQRYGEYAFRINGNIPVIDSFTPDAKKVRPNSEGNFDLNVTASDGDTALLTLIVEEINRINNEDVAVEVARIEKAGIPNSETASGYICTWNIPLQAATEGEYITYQYKVYDGKYNSQTKKRTYQTDTVVPVLRSLVSPVLVASETVVIDGSGVMIKGYSDNDLASAKISYTQASELGAPLANDPRCAAAQVSTDTGAGFTDGTGTYSKVFSGSLVLKDSAGNDSEGDYNLWLRLADDTDVFGDPIKLGTVTVDKNAPTFTETVSGINTTAVQYKNVDVTFGGNVSDTNGIKSVVVTYSKNGGSATDLLRQTTAGSWTATLPTTLGDGSYELVFIATDMANKVTTFSRNIRIDTTAPILIITSPSSGAGVAGTAYTIRGTVDDGSGKGVTLLQYSTVSTTGPWTDIAKAASWNSVVDFSAGGEGSRTLWVRASDGLNPETPETVTFQYDIADPSLAVEATDLYNTTGSVSFAGKWTESNKLTSIDINYKKDGGGSTLLETKAIDANGVNIPWTTGPLPLEDGSYEFEIKAIDAANKLATVNRKIILDKTPPTLEPTWPAIHSDTNTYIDGMVSLDFRGTADDTGGSTLDSIYYALTSDAASAAPDTSPFNASWIGVAGTTSWNTSIDFTAKADGAYTLHTLAKDKAGNYSAVSSRTVYLDKVTPLFTGVSGTAGLTAYQKGDFSITGTVTDINLDTLTYTRTKNGSPNVSSTVIPATSGTTWTLNQTDFVANTLDTYVYTFTALDKSGKSSTEARTVTVDTKAPEIEITSITPIVTGNKVNGIITVKGIISDNDKANTGTYTLQVAGSDVSGFVGISLGANLASWTFDIDTKAAGFTDLATLGIIINAADRAENTATLTDTVTIDQSTDIPTVAYSNITVAGSATVNLLGKTSNNKILGTFTDDDGLKNIDVKLDGVQTPLFDAAALNNTTSKAFSYDVSGLDEGSHTLQFVITDKNDLEVTTSLESFGVDESNPTILITSVQDLYKSPSTSVTVTGTAQDGNAFTSIIDVLSGDAVTVALGDLDKKTIISWTYAFTTLNETGSFTRIFRATDTFGKISTVSYKYSVDVTAPTITPTWPAVHGDLNTYIDGTTPLAFGGSAFDAGGSTLDSIYYALTSDAASAAPDTSPFNASWIGVAGTTSWNTSIDFTAKADGAYTLHTLAKDKAGNYSTVSSKTIYLDKVTPVFKDVSGTAGLTAYQKGDFSITGTVTDTNFDTLTYTRTKNGSPNVSSTVIPATSGTTWTLNQTDFVANTLDTYVYTFTALDKSGKSSTEARTVTVDTKAPEIEITSITPIVTGNKVNGIITVKGIISDNDKANTGTYTLQVAGSDVSGFVGISLGANLASWTFDIDTKAAGFTDLATLGIIINAADRAENTATLTDTVTIDQSTDIPTVAYSNITVAGSATVNLLGKTSNNKILGTFTDDDGLKNIDVKLDGVQTPLFDAAALNNTTSKAFSYDVSGLDEGSHTLQFVITDKNDLEVTTSLESFGVDESNPTILITSVQDLYKSPSTSVTVTGTAQDGNAFTSIIDVLSGDAVTVALGDLDKKTIISWTYAFTTLNETGSFTRIFRATDTFGKISTVSYKYSVDVTAPTITPTWPAVHGDLNTYIDGTTPLAFGGSAFDAGGSTLDSIYYALTSDAASAAPDTSPFNASWIGVAGTTSWNTSIDFTAKADGAYTLHTLAKDKAGNYSTVSSKTIYLDKVTPVFKDVSGIAGVTAYQKGDFSITGTVTDTNFDTLTYTRTKNGSPEVSSTVISATSGLTWTLNQTGFFANTLDTYVYTFTALDKSGKSSTEARTVTVDTKAPEIEITSITPVVDGNKVNGVITVKGTISDNDKVETGTYVYNGSSATVVGANLTSWSFTIDTRDVSDESVLNTVLTLAATDRAGNTGVFSASSLKLSDYTVDQATDIPVISLNYAVYPTTALQVSGTRNLYGKTSNNTLVGTITDDDGINSIIVTVNDVPDATIDLSSTKPMSYSLSKSLSSLAEGVHSISIEVTDSALGKTKTTGTFYIGIDEGAPTLNITSPSQNVYYTGTISILGVMSDGSGLPTLTVSGDGTSSLTQNTNWEDTLLLPTVTGTYTKTYTATDKYNRTSSVSFSYMVDSDKPTIDSFVPPASDYINLPDNPFYRVTGTASDSGGSGLNLVQYSVTAGDATAAPTLGDAAWNSAGGVSSWTANLDMSGSSEGAYTIHIVAKDLAGNYSDVRSRTIYADVGVPSIGATITPVSDSIYKENFNLEGTSEDTFSGLKEISANLKVGTINYPLTNAGTFTLGETSTSWSFPVPVIGGAISVDGTYQITVTAKDRSGKSVSSVYSFVRDITAPSITLNNILTNNSTKLTDTAPQILGLITDTTGIASASYHFQKWYAGAFATPVGHTEKTFVLTAGTKSHAFAIDMNSVGDFTVSDGRWRIVLTANDQANTTPNNTTFTSAEFLIDQTNPNLVITAPASSGSFVKTMDSLYIAGTADDTNGLNKVTVRITGPGTDSTKTVLAGAMTGNAWNVTYPVGTFTNSGNFTVLVTATDSAGRIKELTREVLCDTEPPAITFVSPYAPPATQAAAVIGEITVSGKTTDQSMQSVSYIIGGTLNSTTGVVTYGGAYGTTTEWLAFDNSYSWQTKLQSSDYTANNKFAVQRAMPDASYWDLPVHVRANDTAGNIAYSTISIWIDTNIDKPVATILSPGNNTTMGGTFTVSGGATDNTFVHKVYMQVEIEGATYTSGTDGAGVAYREITDLGAPMTGVNATGTAGVKRFSRIGDSDTAWYEVDTGTNVWRATLNTAKEFYKSNVDLLAGQTPALITGNIIIRVKAIDSKIDPLEKDDNSVYGNPVEVKIKLDEDAPSIEELTGNPVQDSYVNGNIILKMVFRDDVAIETVVIASSTGIDFPIDEATEVVKSDENETYPGKFKTWTLTKTINTSLLAPSGSGTLSINTTVTEKPLDLQTAKSTTSILRLNVDNISPTDRNLGKLTATREIPARGRHIKVAGNRVLLAGEGTDQGSKVDKVIIYFEQGGKIYSMGGLNADGTGADTSGTAMNTITIGADTFYFPEASLTAIKLGKSGGIAQRYMVIDRLEDNNDTGSAGDKDGYSENLNADGTWSVYANSNLIADGLYNVHYVLIDKAGNATHYTDTALVQNNKPTITGIKLYTDVNGNGTIDMTDIDGNIERKSFTEITESMVTGFTTRNNTLAIQVAGTGSNGAMKYKLEYDKGTGTYIPIAADVVDGSIFTLNTAEDFGTDGLATFRVTVEDSLAPLSLTSTQTLLVVTLANTDTERPTVRLSELNSTAEYLNKDKENYEAALAAALKKIAGGSLIKYNSALERDILSGHIELRADSMFNNANADATDPDLSGIVILRGIAHDNQRITGLSIKINNGTAIPILKSNATTGLLQVDEPYATTAGIASQTLSLTTHDVEWSYAWDTSTLSTVTGVNIPFEVIVTDKVGASSTINYSVANADNYNKMTVDVVPYIRNIATTKATDSGIKENNIRGASGAYSIKQGADSTFITLLGYNLKPTTDGVRLSKTADKAGLDADGTTFLGTPLAFSGVVAPYTSMSITNAISSSGYLTVITTAATVNIPTLNNVNAATDYNKEPDSYVTKNELLTDDRYLTLFAVSDTNVKNGYYPTMLMNGNNPVFGYVNSSAADDLQVQRAEFNLAGTQLSMEPLIRGTTWDQMAMARDGSGRYIMMSVHNRGQGSLSYFYDQYASLHTMWTGNYRTNAGAGSPYWSDYKGDLYDNENNNAIVCESVDYESRLVDRYKNPKLIAKGNSQSGTGSFYSLYYDDNTADKQLIFRSFQIAANLSGTDYPLYSGYGRTNLKERDNTTRKTAATNSSQYFDMAVTADNHVVIVYYDETTSNLKFTYSTAALTGANPNTGVTFSTPQIISPAYVGSHVSMTIDGGHIHIAAYDGSEADLMYIFIPSYTTASSYTCVPIDSSFSVGLWTQIKVRNNIPYIAYYNNAENGTRDSLKLAYCKTAITSTDGVVAGTEDGFTTGLWEYMTVPAKSPAQGGIPKFKQVNLDFDTSGNPILGYLGANIEFTRKLPE